MIDPYIRFREELVVSGCRKCPELAAGRTHIVIDRGAPGAPLVVVGEAPGETEDREGRAFVGRSGRLLDAMLADAGFSPARDVLIANVVKCRPPGNRAPTREEAENCLPYLTRQLALADPEAVLLLGATAARHFLPPAKGPLSERVGRFCAAPAHPGLPFFLSYHPAFVLRDPRRRAAVTRHFRTLKNSLTMREGVCIR